MLLAIAAMAYSHSAACRDVAGMPRMHEWTRAAESTGQCFQNTSNLVVRAFAASKTKFTLAWLGLLVAYTASAFFWGPRFSPTEPSEGVPRGASVLRRKTLGPQS